MTMPPELQDLVRTAAIAIACVGGYLLFKQRLMRLATGARHRAALSGEALLATGRLPAQHAGAVRFGLDHFFNGWLPWVYVVVAPIYVVAVVCGRVAAPTPLADEKLDVWYAVFAQQWWVALMAQSPLAAFCLLVEAPALLLLWSCAPHRPLLSGLLSAAPPAVGGVEEGGR